MRQVTMRYMLPGLNPRRTRMEIPGWAGDRSPRADGSREQVWHCTPFTEGAQYGIEIFYPYDKELKVSMRDGRLDIEHDFGPPPEEGVEWPPFRSFGNVYFTYQVLLDLNPGDGYAIRTEPHPRFYADTTGTCPIAVPALIRNWWPMMFFMVFKSPGEGQTHIFRPGEPMAQILVIPETADFELVEMSMEEQAERELRSRRIYAARSTVNADTTWRSQTHTVFDGTYRHMARAAKAKAMKGPPENG
ncbi:MAG: hypothetical protein KGM15_14525 [Pseudomonadota bacterium]|nr:hypothetical protein [Pseudomonadota bacterium]